MQITIVEIEREFGVPRGQLPPEVAAAILKQQDGKTTPEEMWEELKGIARRFKFSNYICDKMLTHSGEITEEYLQRWFYRATEQWDELNAGKPSSYDDGVHPFIGSPSGLSA